MGVQANKSEFIVVAYATDNNYLFYTSVSIASLLENAGEDTYYKVYILVGDAFIDEENILGGLQERYSNLEIQVCRVDDKKFSNVYINNKHLTKTAYYRLVMTDYIKEDKCIYLDSDTLVMSDLSDLWNVDVEEYYLAGCRDIWMDWFSEEERELRREQSNLPSMDQYINSGVLLFNLKKIRNDGMTTKFLNEMKNKYPYEDQDILNLCCYNYIKRLPEKWNQFTEVFFSRDLVKNANISKEIERQFYVTDGIIHYTNKVAAPWKGMMAWRNDDWWKIAAHLNFTNKYQQLRERVEERERFRNWKYILELCNKYSKVVIWGYTAHAKEIYDRLCSFCKNTDFVFCDRDVEKQNQRYKDIPVISPEQEVENKEDCLYFIVSQIHGKAIKEELLQQQVIDKNILLYERKGFQYYRFLSEHFYECELMEISLKEGIDIELLQQKDYLQTREDLCEKYCLFSWLLEERKII